MTRALVPLSMTTIGMLPERCRGCVAWELDADAVRSAVRLGDTEFEKEVWLSGVMLTWGSAGQIVTVDDKPVGFALFAPPTAVPGAAAFPTSPVSPDAVLLTTARILPELHRAGPRALPDERGGHRADPARRAGDRAVRAGGRARSRERAGKRHAAAAERSTASDAGASTWIAARTAIRHSRSACCRRGSPGRSGFEDVAPHHQYPRLRFELGRDIGWKAEVESALEKLFTVITVPASPSPLVPELVGQR